MIIAIMVTIREFFTVLGCLGQSGKCSTLLVRGSREDLLNALHERNRTRNTKTGLGGGGEGSQGARASTAARLSKGFFSGDEAARTAFGHAYVDASTFKYLVPPRSVVFPRPSRAYLTLRDLILSYLS